MTNIKLKSCPFCGGKAELVTCGLYAFYIRCKQCRMGSGVYEKKREAVIAWNMRVNYDNSR